MKFSRRKDCQNVLNAKEELRKLDIKEIGFPEDNPIFVNESLCTYYRALWSKAKRLHYLKRISSIYVSGGTVKIKISENSLPLPITHVNDFKENFLRFIQLEIHIWISSRPCWYSKFFKKDPIFMFYDRCLHSPHLAQSHHYQAKW